MEKMSTDNSPKKRKYLSNEHKIKGAHVQCVNNDHSAKFKYKGMKTVGVTEYTNQTSPKHFEQKNVLSTRPQKMKRIFM